MDASQRTIFKQASQGDSKALNLVWKYWHPRIQIFLRNTTGLSHEDCEDLEQDIMCKIINSLHKYNSIYAPGTWVYTIAKNMVIDWSRKGKTSLCITPESQLSESDQFKYCNSKSSFSSPEDIFLAGTMNRIIREFILEQSPADRQILFLISHEGLSGRKTAKIMDLPASTVRDRLNRLKNKLQEVLDETQ